MVHFVYLYVYLYVWQFINVCLPFHPNVDLASMHSMEETLHECGPLQSKSCDQEVEAHAAEAITLQEGHKEAETNEDHHVHVLETCTWEKKQIDDFGA